MKMPTDFSSVAPVSGRLARACLSLFYEDVVRRSRSSEGGSERRSQDGVSLPRVDPDANAHHSTATSRPIGRTTSSGARLQDGMTQLSGRVASECTQTARTTVTSRPIPVYLSTSIPILSDNEEAADPRIRQRHRCSHVTPATTADPIERVFTF